MLCCFGGSSMVLFVFVKAPIKFLIFHFVTFGMEMYG